NTLLGVPLKLLYPLAWLLNGISLLLLRPFARKTGVVKKSDEPLPDHDDEPEPEADQSRSHGMPGIHALDN
ncbi:TPA: hypothetical protein ACYHGJ_002905, partial [Staphylococcus aureus]